MAEASDSSRTLYPNSPLQSVVFEIRFPGEPAVECHRDAFFRQARNEFPRVLVPTLEAGTAAALSPYQFQREDESASLLTAINLFAFRTSSYAGFPMFREEVIKWIRVFAEEFRIGKINRTGLRYTNVIPYAPGETFPVTSFLDIAVKLGVVESGEFTRFSLDAVIPRPSGGNLTVQVKEVQNQLDGSAAILLDFDFAFSGPELHVDSVEQYLDESNRETKYLFEGLLTDRYRSFLRGEGLE